MIIQQNVRTDPERAWIVATNSDGQTITQHYPVFKITSGRNTSSVSTNEYASRHAIAAGLLADDSGGFVGLADEDIADTQPGIVQAYGYHESALVMRIASSVTVRPGHAMGIGAMNAANSIGLSSVGNVFHPYGPVVALDTVTATMHSLGTVGQNYADHVFLRCL